MNLSQLLARVATMVARGVLSRIDDSSPTQLVQVETYDGVISDDVEHFQPWGVSFRPTPESEVLVFAVGGAQEHLMALAATDRDFRPTGLTDDGTGGLYTKNGWFIFCDKDGNVGIGSQYPANKLARADRVEAELEKISTDLKALSGAGTTNPVLSYIKGPGSVGADKVKGD